MYCKKCGKEFAADATFCPHCGQSVAPSTPIGMEKTFHPKRTAGLLPKAFALGFGLGAVLLIFAYTQLPWYTSAQERYILMGAALIAVVVCLQNLVGIFNRAKVQLRLDARTVSGVTVHGISTQKFEYDYSEITDVMCSLGAVSIRANGKWLAIPGLENADEAKKLIEQRIAKK